MYKFNAIFDHLQTNAHISQNHLYTKWLKDFCTPHMMRIIMVAMEVLQIDVRVTLAKLCPLSLQTFVCAIMLGFCKSNYIFTYACTLVILCCITWTIATYIYYNTLGIDTIYFLITTELTLSLTNKGYKYKSRFRTCWNGTRNIKYLGISRVFLEAMEHWAQDW